MNTQKKDYSLSVGLSVAQGLSYLTRGTPEAEHIWNFGVDALAAAEIHRDHAAIAECIRAAARTLGHTHHSRTVGLLNHIEEQYVKYDGNARRKPTEPITRHTYPHTSEGTRDSRGIDVM